MVRVGGDGHVTSTVNVGVEDIGDCRGDGIMNIVPLVSNGCQHQWQFWVIQYFSTCVGDTMDMFPCSGLCGAGELVEGQQVGQCCSSAESKLVLS